jgi:hypothetical protein
MTVDVPEYPKGHSIEVPPFGKFENGESQEVEMSTEDAERYRGSHGISIRTESRRKTSADRAAEQQETVSTIEDAPQNEGGDE